jgi:hypothetical protein
MKKEDLKFEIEEIKNAKELENFINKNGTNLGELNWHMITKSPAFSVKMIDKYSDHLDWQWLCTFYDLNESILEKYTGMIDWYSVSSFQNLSLKFIKKYKDMLSMDKVIRNDRIIKSIDYMKIYDIYNKLKDDKHYQEIWHNNLMSNSLFRPLNTAVPAKKKPKAAKKIIKLSKNAMKKILKKRGVRVLYHDTLDILREKMAESA